MVLFIYTPQNNVRITVILELEGVNDHKYVDTQTPHPYVPVVHFILKPLAGCWSSLTTSTLLGRQD